MKNKEKNIVIWGFGKVGVAALHFFSSLKYNCIIIDKKKLLEKEKSILKKYNATFIKENNIKTLFPCLVLPSPGVDIEKYYATKQLRIICELDLFSLFFKKYTIAITGSVGKTSITSCFAHILKTNNINCFVGGNIGIPMLEAINKTYECALLEVSSFQLEYTNLFAPDIAILTNIYSNHLDRHKTIKKYVDAKLRIFTQQKRYQYAIMPLSLKSFISQQITLLQKCIFFSPQAPTKNEKNSIKKNDIIIFLHNKTIFLYQKNNYHTFSTIPQNPIHFFPQNWLVINALLYLLKINPKHIFQNNISIPEHRLEQIAVHNNIIFYNDSKSTTPASTIAALKQFPNQKTHLFLGGLSKGIDRETLIISCKKKNIFIYIFGKEKNRLYYFCIKHGIPASAHDTLEKAFGYCMQQVKSNEIVLFSPAGSSFDLYSNYQERGAHFKKIVKKYLDRNNTCTN